MCNNCQNPGCNGTCSFTYQNYPCPQFPPPAGPVGSQGIAGPQGLSAVNVEIGSFTRLSINGGGNFVVGTANEVITIQFTATELVPTTGSGSIGNACLGQNTCITNSSGIVTIDPTNSINVVIVGDGFRGILTTIASNSFNINWTLVGAGKDILIAWQAIVKV